MRIFKKVAILTVISLILILISAFFYFKISSNNRTEIKENLSKLSEAKTVQECDSLAETTNDQDICKKLAIFPVK